MAIKFGGADFDRAYLRRTFAQGLPKGEPITLVWSLYLDSDRDTFGTYIAMGPTTFTGGTDYYVCFHHHTPEEFAIGIEGADIRGDAVSTGRWLRQAFRRRITSGSNTENLFWTDLPKAAVISAPTTTGVLSIGATHELAIGDAHWSGGEFIDGRMMGVKVWQAALPAEAIRKESESIWPVLERYRPWLWAVWPMPIPGDVRDYSGHGRHLERVLGGSGTLTGIGHAPVLITPDPRIASFRRLAISGPTVVLQQAGGGGLFRIAPRRWG